MNDLKTMNLITVIAGLYRCADNARQRTGCGFDDLVVINPRPGAFIVLSPNQFDERFLLDDATYERFFGDDPRIERLQSALDTALDYLDDVAYVLGPIMTDLADADTVIAHVEAIAAGDD